MIDFLIIFLADWLIYFLAFGVLVYCITTRSKVLFRQCLTTVSMTWFIGWIIKNLFYFPRPFILTGRTPLAGLPLDGTFPSNHTVIAFSLAFPFLLSHRKGGLVVLMMAFLVALGRILGGVHTAVDITAGILISALVSRIVHRWG
jgi:undecaprenyl-diphosphatase